MKKSYYRSIVTMVAVTLFAATASAKTPLANNQYTGSWAQVADILESVNPPSFPDKDFDIKDYGAKEGGKKDSRQAIMDTIVACCEAGGGRVVVPAGDYLCNGPIHLESNVNLHLSEGSRILFGTDFDDYLPPVLTRWECTRIYNYSPLVYAYQKENIAVTGKGILDGQAEDTWIKMSKNAGKDQSLNREMNHNRVPIEERVFGKGHNLRPPMVQFYECENILIEEITILDSPFWCLHPVFSKNITIRNIKFTAMNPNNDGIDLDSCEDVYVHDVVFANDDDNLVIKSGRDTEGRELSRPTRNVYVRDCIFNAYTGVAIGSELSGSIYNIFVENSHAESKCKRGFNIKANRDRGGEVSHIRFRNVQFLDTSNEMFVISATYGNSDGDYPPYYHDIRWEDCSGEGDCQIGLRIEGQPDIPVENVVLKNISVKKGKKAINIERVNNLIAQNVTIVGEKLKDSDNLPPDLYAGRDQSIAKPGTIVLKGNVSDDGVPSNKLSYEWSVIQGDAGAVKFEAPNSLTTKAKFNKEGLYVIKLNVSDSKLEGYHFLMVEVGEQEGISAVTKPIFQHGG
jgi:polygalacturonase